MQVILSRRHLISSLLIAGGIVLLAGCQGLAPSSTTGGGGATIAASPSVISFGNVQKNKTMDHSDTLTNTGGTSVTVSEVSLTSASFSVSGLSLPMTLAPKQSVTFTVTFAPTAPGPASGALAVVSTADNSPLNIAVSGTGTTQGQLSVTPATLSFGNVVVGSSGTLNGTLNASGASVTISGASISGSEFTLSGLSLPTTLNAGQSAPFTVTFTPAASGTASATLAVSSDAGNSPGSEALTGKGVAPAAHRVDLSWEASTTPGVVGYNVYRGIVSGGPYSQINSALEAALAYSDTTVAAGQTYYYVTTAVDGSGSESGYSNQTKAVVSAP